MYVIDESSYRVDKTNFPTLEEAQQKAGEAARILNRPINVYQLSAGELNFSVRVMPDGGIEHENPLTNPGPTDTIGPTMPSLGKVQVLDEVAEVLEQAGKPDLAAKVDAEAHTFKNAPRGTAAVAHRLKDLASKKKSVKNNRAVGASGPDQIASFLNGMVNQVRDHLRTLMGQMDYYIGGAGADQLDDKARRALSDAKRELDNWERRELAKLHDLAREVKGI